MLAQFSPNPAQPATHTACQTAAIVALAAAEDQLVITCGISRALARQLSRTAIRAFLVHMSDHQFPIERVHRTTEEFLEACRYAQRFSQHDDDGGAA